MEIMASYKKATTAQPLKYLCHFWWSLETPLINYNVELKMKWTKYCLLSFGSADNDYANSDNKTKSDQNFSPKDSKMTTMYWKSENKTKSENKSSTNEYGYFLKSNFVGVNRLFALIYSNEDENAKRFKTRRFYLLKYVISNEKKPLLTTSWLWYKTKWRNNKVNRRARWRLYYRMFVGLWFHQ